MDEIVLSLANYTFKFAEPSPEIEYSYSTKVSFTVKGKDVYGHIRSVELESIKSSADGFYLTVDESDENEYVYLNFPTVLADEGETYRRFPLKFIVGYTDYDTDYYDEADVQYVSIDVDVYATLPSYGDPAITYIENVATKVTDSANIVVHGTSLTDGLSIKLYNGEKEYVIEPDDIRFDIDSEGTGTASFSVAPGMLAMDADGSEPCAQYSVYFSYGRQNYADGSFAIIRYKFDADTEATQKYSLEGVTREKECYRTGTMELILDTVDEHGNTVTNADADPRLGRTIYFKVDPERCATEENPYFYTMVRVKYNKNLMHKNGELTLNGIKLYEGDVVWLTNQLNDAENGLWVVSAGQWTGFDPYPENREESDSACPLDCYAPPKPYPVDDSVLIDLGVKASYPVDYVCGDDVPYKCGTRTICNYTVTPGMVVALYNQGNDEEGRSENGVYLVTCGNWVKLSDLNEEDISGTTVDFTRNVIVQNNIEFCNCGGIYYIDYYFLTPSCYMHHLRRTVKIVCGGASIAPNDSKHQFSITEYVIKSGVEDALIGNNGRTPGDPVKEDCVQSNDDIETASGLRTRESLQEIPEGEIDCISSPACARVCDIPRFYNFVVPMPSDYTNSNDANGFTIKFWRYEEDGWNLYAYIGSGTRLTGIDYYVYHLHVRGSAVESQIDVNEHSWFTSNGGVLAVGDAEVIPGDETVLGDRVFINSFCLTDDTWDLPMSVYNEETGETTVVYSTNLDSDEKLYSNWRIRCTTTMLARRGQESEGDLDERKTCADMADAVRDELARGSEETPGYLYGMRHIWGFAYYKRVMSKSEFCAEYNRYVSSSGDCLWVENMIVTDDTPEVVDDKIINHVIATDPNEHGDMYGLRR